jgi:hypothetical protein
VDVKKSRLVAKTSTRYPLLNPPPPIPIDCISTCPRHHPQRVSRGEIVDGTHRDLGSKVIPNVTRGKGVLDEERYLVRHVQVHVLGQRGRFGKVGEVFDGECRVDRLLLVVRQSDSQESG